MAMSIEQACRNLSDSDRGEKCLLALGSFLDIMVGLDLKNHASVQVIIETMPNYPTVTREMVSKYNQHNADTKPNPSPFMGKYLHEIEPTVKDVRKGCSQTMAISKLKETLAEKCARHVREQKEIDALAEWLDDHGE